MKTKIKSIWYDIKMLNPHVNTKKLNDYLSVIKYGKLKIIKQVTVRNLNPNLSFLFDDKISKNSHKLIISNVQFNYNKVICFLEKNKIINVVCKCSNITVDGKSVSQFLKDLYYSNLL